MPNSFHLKIQSLYFRELAYIEELKGPRHDLRLKKLKNFLYQMIYMCIWYDLPKFQC